MNNNKHIQEEKRDGKTRWRWFRGMRSWLQKGKTCILDEDIAQGGPRNPSCKTFSTRFLLGETINVSGMTRQSQDAPKVVLTSNCCSSSAVDVMLASERPHHLTTMDVLTLMRFACLTPSSSANSFFIPADMLSSAFITQSQAIALVVGLKPCFLAELRNCLAGVRLPGLTGGAVRARMCGGSKDSSV